MPHPSSTGHTFDHPRDPNRTGTYWGMLDCRMRYHFDEFVLDEDSFELFQGGVRLEVQPKVLDVLRYLITHRDRLVTRDELLQQVWPNVVVGDASLARAV